MSSRSATSPLRRWTGKPARPEGRAAAAGTRAKALLVALAQCACGCSELNLDAAVKKIFEPRRTPQQYMLIAVSDADSDIRREAIAKVARSDQNRLDWAIQGFVAIALLESDPHARCVAIRALRQSGDPRAVEVCLKLLNHREYPPQEVREPDDVVRWEAATALAGLCEQQAVPEPSRAAVRETFLKLLPSDPSRHVRIGAARGLGCFPDVQSLEALLQALRDEDFAVVHQAESSLVKLTGQTHHCNALDWQAWYEANRQQPFANAGSVPESRRPPYDSRLEKIAYDTRQVLEWLWPGRKK